MIKYNSSRDQGSLTSKIGNKARSVAFGAAALLMGSILGVGGVSASDKTITLPLATSTINKIIDAPSLADMMQANATGRYRVIVKYKRPEMAGAQTSANGVPVVEDDEAFISQNHALQDQLMSEVFGSPEAMLSGPLSDQYGVTRLDYSPLVAMSLTAAEIDQIAASEMVEGIQPDVPIPAVMDQSTVHVDIPAVWTAGGTGTGRTVAILDTGVKKAHEFITAGRVVSEACYNLTHAPLGSTSFCPGGDSSTVAGSGADCSETTAAGCSHGTHVTGTAAGFNTNLQGGEPTKGMAYQANIIGINIFSLFNSVSTCSPGPSPCVLTYNTNQIQGLERVYALRNTYNIDAVNMSIGGGQHFVACDSDTRKVTIDLLRAANIATVIAAGNDGFNTSVSAPGCISTAITVASSLDNADTRSSFSNWGTLIDVVAPGSTIQSSIYGTTVGNTTAYDNYNGTSMATPHVVGAFASLRTLYPSATVTQIESALETTGTGITSSSVTKPRIDMDDACNNLGSACSGVLIVASVLPNARATQTGGTVTAFANIYNAGTNTATDCSIALPGPISGTEFSYQTVDGSNIPSGTVNTPVSIAPATLQGFFFAFTPSTPVSTNIALVFDCTNSDPVSTIWGVNTFAMTGSATPIADMISIAATIGNTGYITLPGNMGVQLATVTAFNLGAAQSVTASITEQAIGGTDPNMPANLFLCLTDAVGTCLSGYGTSHTFVAGAGLPYYFTMLVGGTGFIADNPALNRVHLYFDAAGSTVGATSVGLRTGP